MRTFEAYELASVAFGNEWHDQPAPTDIYGLVSRFFLPGNTADIGCGAGRDTAWLDMNGFDPTGYDPSQGLLTQARIRYPRSNFIEAALPELEPVAAESFTNVFCETVIMHLREAQIGPSIRRLLSILRPAGILYLSWRVTKDNDYRDSQGRLYTAFASSLVLRELGSATILHEEEVISASSRRVVHRVVAKKGGAADTN
jgi:SAM-dependent methyltransferase